ncbi:thioredoxin family protein [Cryobacterium adonitolivorans]|uniref:Thioredoxin family protein n=1 Tax=Cryobacterium adonitolivorans TaxID=1259189 RepID=A0A4R8W8B7_9MICO|nr:thioredoxin family protein [Cryobacterium adonitolivorans]
MRIEILHIDECPNWVEAGHRLQAALDNTGNPDIAVAYRLLRTSEDAAKVPFAGSPTFTLNGEDLFATDGRTTDLACRIYFTPSGLAGLPTTEQLMKAIASRED